MSSVDRNRIEAGLAKYRERLEGTVLTPAVANRVATPDAIRRFADGLGDRNPLWRDEEYAKGSVHEGPLAPPAFLNAVSEGQAIVGLPGLVATFVGAEWEWGALLRANDSFSVTNELLPLEDVTASGEGLRVLQSGVIRYRNQRGEEAGRCRWRLLRTEAGLGGRERGEGERGGGHPGPRRYGDEEVARLCEEIEAEEIRGAVPRYFEDVREGDVVPPVVKGPLSLSDMIAWAAGTGWHRTALAHGPKLLFLKENPGLSYLDPETGVPEPIALSHFDARAAYLLMRSPRPMDLGFQRVCWMSHPITNWMSDVGFLKRMSVRLTGFVRFGDLCRAGAVVTGKRSANGEHTVELELTCRKNAGEPVAAGTASVVLPSRAAPSALPGQRGASSTTSRES
ncbi:MAG: MaoC family dehydratase N-terminal domain-containing protein [Deltaproteobacteria bacterium]|nr:MaoC family dehydratase N-terminal domain-containing protein [Deltaproteobacteria bacterium]